MESYYIVFINIKTGERLQFNITGAAVDEMLNIVNNLPKGEDKLPIFAGSKIYFYGGSSMDKNTNNV